jgi:hypothetical protein
MVIRHSKTDQEGQGAEIAIRGPFMADLGGVPKRFCSHNSRVYTLLTR